MGAGLSAPPRPPILAKSFYRPVKVHTSSVFAFLSFFRLQEMIKGKKILVCFLPWSQERVIFAKFSLRSREVLSSLRWRSPWQRQKGVAV